MSSSISLNRPLGAGGIKSWLADASMYAGNEFVENVFKYSVYVVSYLITVKQVLHLYLTLLILIS